MNFDWLGNTIRNLQGFMQNAPNSLSTTLSQFLPTSNYSSGLTPQKAPPKLNIPPQQVIQAPGNDQAIAQANQMRAQSGLSPIGGTSTPQPLAQPNLNQLTQMYQQGFNRFDPNAPIATMSGQLAQLAMLHPNIDPRFFGALPLQETHGGARQLGLNNPFNVTGQQAGNPSPFVNYPSPLIAMMGGQNGPYTSQGLNGLLSNDPRYASFNQTGNLADFLNVFTPPGAQYGNPSLAQQLMDYNSLMSLFTLPGAIAQR